MVIMDFEAHRALACEHRDEIAQKLRAYLDETLGIPNRLRRGAVGRALCPLRRPTPFVIPMFC
ncbi:hypothetical protein [Bradyrhizobium sp. sBnM-33]|uniref:hypothetical protein n=1 Tax=Bradyrhizobium sp. sBnM-33 TaxID=2831780 RepID=UPI001BD09C8B|nr:hypothetical protein [Bradyrhizobium sp. sBnM-33]WOH52471.1 hypothetical protein RX328_09995 [Bradyrhizobium sp. sBnM-33]